MRIFVAGATGDVGRPLVRALVSAGHSVAGPTRSAAKVEAIKRMGAEPVVADGLDAASIRTAVVSVRPEIIIHEMTDLGNVMDLRHFDRTFAATNALRTRGTDHLLVAAREAGVKRFIAQSYCGWTFARTDGLVKTEADELDPAPPLEFRRTLQASQHLERTATGSVGPAGIARSVSCEHTVAMMWQVRSGSNADATRELGWHPAHSSRRFGFAETARQSVGRPVAACAPRS